MKNCKVKINKTVNLFGGEIRVTEVNFKHNFVCLNDITKNLGKKVNLKKSDRPSTYLNSVNGVAAVKSLTSKGITPYVVIRNGNSGFTFAHKDIARKYINWLPSDYSAIKEFDNVTKEHLEDFVKQPLVSNPVTQKPVAVKHSTSLSKEDALKALEVLEVYVKQHKK